MKKGLALLCTIALLFTLLASCGTKDDSATPATATPDTSTAAPTATPDEVPPDVTEVNWPSSSTVNFDVAAKAGGGTDLIVRFITAGWSEVVDANFVVTNYDTSEVGNQHLKNADPDGMTLGVSSCTLMDGYLSGTSEVHPVDDLTVISKVIAGGAQVLFTGPDAPYSNLQEMKEYAAANPGEIIAGVNLGATSHLMWLRIADSMGGVELNYVQAASEADKLTYVASGSIDVGNCSLNNAIGYEADGKIKILGIIEHSTDFDRDDYMEGLGDQYLTCHEQGFENAYWSAGSYIVGPANMDPAVVDAINASLAEAVTTQVFLDGMVQMSQNVDVKSPADSLAEYLTEWELQRELTSAAGINIRD